ncbi:MAG: 1,4-alpha-glucan branching protein GlgB [Saprospiraceae bacterium]|nr:1,4-alpha-glucan branching protein GlgB [Saprospiraceae bacterium]MBP7699261.1 1,4-alpha-glucan branching protein GlgB [Saprospiraceae bacterium]
MPTFASAKIIIMQHFSLFSEQDIQLFAAGKHYRIYEKLGCHFVEHEGKKGAYFAVWAPTALDVSVMGNFNNWNTGTHPLQARWDGSGIWEGFYEGIGKGEVYKYNIRTYQNFRIEKADPYSLFMEEPPRTASITWDLDYHWQDKDWMQQRKQSEGKPLPYNVYEVHLGSWKKLQDEGGRFLRYTEMAEQLVNYVKEMGYSHVELMPVMEHPFYGSWGYQITGYYAPSNRYGTPQDFMYLVDKFHQAGIGVILDWVPSHFPVDIHGLAYFDGTHLYEHADPRKGFHPDWKSYIFNYGRNEVRSFLISNAIFWLEKYHIDGLRVDAVASMLYLDYSRKENEWVPNQQGGKENLEAISFLKEFNETVYREFPDIVTIAEESTSWPKVSRPTYENGLGFGQKWMMGWMHDTLNYFKREPIYRPWHQNELTFAMMYAYTENFMLPLSHDEVVHGKGSLYTRMPGDEWRKLAQLRLLFSYMYTHPGSKLMFMGGEFGQIWEWSHDRGLDWGVLERTGHQQLQQFVKRLNHLYQAMPALWYYQFSHEGFEWFDLNDKDNSVLVYYRKGTDEHQPLLVVCNFSAKVHLQYQIGVHLETTWKEMLNSDAIEFGGSGVVNTEILNSETAPCHQKDYSIFIKLAPLACMVFAPIIKKPKIAKPKIKKADAKTSAKK